MGEVCKRLRIHGRVQGVFYRAWSAETARALGLRGWVRNRRDGTVELVAEGEEAAVERLIDRCRDGPPSAEVDRIDIEDEAAEGLTGFETRATL